MKRPPYPRTAKYRMLFISFLINNNDREYMTFHVVFDAEFQFSGHKLKKLFEKSEFNSVG